MTTFKRPSAARAPVPAITGEKAAAHADALEWGVEVGEGGLRQARHGVPVQGQQGQRVDAAERRLRDRPQQVEAQI